MTVLNQIPEKIQKLIGDYKEDIEKAWLNRDDELSITLSIKLSVKEGKNNCEVGISFIKEKIKDKISFTWDDRQGELNLKEGKENAI